MIDKDKTSSCLLTKEEENQLWHRRLGHLSQKNMRKLTITHAIRDDPDLKREREYDCSACSKGKYVRKQYKTKEFSSEAVLDIVHIDLCGPMRTKGLKGERYFVLFVDDYSRRTCIIHLKHKSEVLKCFKRYRKLAENKSGKKIKVLRSN